MKMLDPEDFRMIARFVMNFEDLRVSINHIREAVRVLQKIDSRSTYRGSLSPDEQDQLKGAVDRFKFIESMLPDTRRLLAKIARVTEEQVREKDLQTRSRRRIRV